ncbi:hypothetical protein HanRHA438_Chr17g0838861 [Helianthus annuus]|nr:hypothetical protein HanRHA438_Chr17g0838861 [Helianthus annuus]
MIWRPTSLVGMAMGRVLVGYPNSIPISSCKIISNIRPSTRQVLDGYLPVGYWAWAYPSGIW